MTPVTFTSVYSVTKHRGFVPSLEYFNKQVFSKDLSNYKVMKPGTFAYATIHLDEGSIGVAPVDCLISPMYTAFQVDASRVDPDYFIRFLKSPGTVRRYATLGRGTAERRRAISLDALGSLRIKLPPLAEQRRIASILDGVDGVLRDRSISLNKLARLSDSLVSDALQQPGRDCTLGEIAAVQGGLTVNSSRSRHSRTVGYLRVANVGRGRIDTQDLKELGVTDDEVARVALMPEDLVLVEGHGNPDEVGRAARWIGSSEPMVHQNHLIRARLDEKVAVPRFLEAYINGPKGRRYFRSVGKTTSGLNTINVTSVRSMPIELPSLEVQQRIATHLSAIEQHERLLLSHLASLDELFAALQWRAFRDL